MSRVSVYIIAYNEAEKVRATVESALWADEVIVVDSWSTDGTAEIAASLGARVVQVFANALNNAVKHSGAREVWLRLRLDGGTLRLALQDDGRGFDPAAATTGSGLKNMAGRLRTANFLSVASYSTTTRWRFRDES
jgi:signal transduction histidine kinase